MTKKDFQLIAGTIHDAAHFVHGLTSVQREAVTAHYAHAFADALATTNPLFKRELFIQAATGSNALSRTLAKEVATDNYTKPDARRTLASDLAEDR